MKPIKKKTAKLFIVFIAIAAVIGSIITFVPMKFGNTRFTSILGSVQASPDLGAGVYAEYYLVDEYSDYQINNSIETIKGVLNDEGYAEANVFCLDGEKIRIEVGYPENNAGLRETYAALSAIGVGAFELRSGDGEDKAFIFGKDHIKSVDISNMNSINYVMLNFNDDGLEAFKNLLADGTNKIHVFMGGNQVTEFSSEGMTAMKSLPLSVGNYESAVDFALKVRLGSLDVELNSNTVHINTMSSTMYSGDLTANPSSGLFGKSAALVASLIAGLLLIVLSLVFMIIKFGMLGVFNAIAILFDSIIAIILIWAFPWMELGLSSIIAIAMGYAVLLTSSLIFAFRFEDEYLQGKTISASFEGAFKKSLSSILAIGIALTVIFGIVALVANAELKVFGLITCIFSLLSMFSSLIMLPGFIKIFEAFNDGATKPYRLPKREEE